MCYVKLFRQITASDIGRRMSKGMIWSFTGTALAKFLTLCSGIICAHILSTADYGALGMVRSTINMFVVLGASGLGVTATKYISEYRESSPDMVTKIYYTANTFAIFTGCVCTFLILLFSNTLSFIFLKTPTLSNTIRLGAVLLFFSIINGVQNGTLMGFEDFKHIAINTLIGSIAEMLFMLLGAYFYGLNGAVLGFGIGFIVIYVANRYIIKHIFRDRQIPHMSIKQIKLEDFKVILHYSLPAALSALLIAPVFFLLRTILVRNAGLSELAIFEAADQWKIIILFIPTAISQIVLPILSNISKHKTSFIHTLKLNIWIIAVVSFLIALIVYILSDFIMSSYGRIYSTNVLPLKILAVSTIFSAIANVIEMAIYSMGKVWYCFAINSIWAVTAIICTSCLVSIGLGATGVSIAVLVAYIVTSLLFSLLLAWQIRTVKKTHD